MSQPGKLCQSDLLPAGASLSMGLAGALGGQAETIKRGLRDLQGTSRVSAMDTPPHLQSPREPAFVQLLEVGVTGSRLMRHYTRDQFLASLAQYGLLPRDLRLLLKPPEAVTYSGDRAKFPTLLVRPASKCFIFHMEHLKLLCFADRCLVFNPQDKATERFMADVTRAQSFQNAVDFEHMLLEIAFESVINKFRRHIKIKKPALEMLLQQIEQNPETSGLKRLLAVKKSLLDFEQRVEHARKVVQHLLEDDEDMSALLMTSPHLDRAGREQVKLLMEAHEADLDEIETETKVFTDMIEDTDQFISAHLDSVRNEIIKLSLYLEMGALVMSSGAVVSGVFGMNLTNSLEDTSSAFLMVCLGILILMAGIFVFFYSRYYQLTVDNRSAHSFTLLKSFLMYVEDLEYIQIDEKGPDSLDFKTAVEKITNMKISEPESKYLSSLFESGNEGFHSTDEKENIQAKILSDENVN